MKQKKGKIPPATVLETPKVIATSPLLRWGVLGAGVLLFALVCFLLNRPGDGKQRDAAISEYLPARVAEVLADNAEPDTWTEGRRLGMQELVLEILQGPYKGQQLRYTHVMNAYYNVDTKVGTRVIVLLDFEDPDAPFVANLFNYDRGIILGALVLLFFAALIFFGGKKGLMALLSLFFTLAAVWFILIPMIFRGVPPIPATILIIALTTAAALTFIDGFTKKAVCAMLGCVSGTLMAGGIAWLVGTLVPLNGFNMSEAEDLVLRGFDYNLSISGLLVAGILISALGAVMDMSMGIASAAHEIHTLNPELTPGQVYRSAMNIGKDTMGTMANSLILAFAGAALNMLLLFRIFGYPFLQIINSNMMAIEIIQGLSGAIGIVLSVPLVAFISALVMTRSKH